MRTLLALVMVLYAAGVASADKTPSGTYVIDKTIKGKDLSTKVEGTPGCEEESHGSMKYEPDAFLHAEITYAKSGQRVIFGTQIMDFISDDGKSAMAMHLDDKNKSFTMLTTVAFFLINENDPRAAIKVLMSVADESKRIVCSDVYWYGGHHE